MLNSLLKTGPVLLTSILVVCGKAQAQDWQPLTGADNLRALVSDTDFESLVTEDVKATSRYNADGTGVVKAWGETFQRTWEISSDGQICINYGERVDCVEIEQDPARPGVYLDSISL